MLNPSAYNPAWVGTEQTAFATIQFRSQWTGYQSSFDGKGGAPVTQLFSAGIPIRSSITAIGFNVVNDHIGPVNQFQMSVPLSYDIETRRGQLTIGLSPGVYSQTQNFNELRFNDPSDVFNVGTSETQTKPNLGAGVLYSFQSELYIGLSANNLFEPNFDFGLDSLTNTKDRSYSLMAGFERRITRNLSIKPSLMIRSTVNVTTFDVNILFTMFDKAWAGASYRFEEAVVFMVGYSVLPDNRLRFGYAIDYIIDESNAKQTTSQEVFIKYSMPELVIGGKKQVKTPRFTH
jgi:type IX secretion system PorP/SprF family membrane protein